MVQPQQPGMVTQSPHPEERTGTWVTLRSEAMHASTDTAPQAVVSSPLGV